VHYTPLSAVTVNELLGLLAWDFLAGSVIFCATWRLIRTPRECFSYGLLSKTGWLVASLWFTWHLGLVALPVGACATLWHLHKLARRGAAAEDIPFAEGVPVDREVR